MKVKAHTESGGNISRDGWLQRHVLLAATVIPVISVLIGIWVEQAAIWPDSWRQVLRTAGTMSPFAASAYTIITLALEGVGTLMFKAWEEHKERMAAMHRRGLEEGLKEGLEEGLKEGLEQGLERGRAEATEEYERRWERARAAVMRVTGQDLDSLVNGNQRGPEEGQSA